MTFQLDQQSQPTTAQPVRICTLDEIPLGLGRAFNVAGRAIAVFRTRQGKIFAVENRCPHKGGPLAEGMLAGDQVVCPLHAFRYELATGSCDQAATCAVQTFPVLLKEDHVHIILSPQDKQENT